MSPCSLNFDDASIIGWVHDHLRGVLVFNGRRSMTQVSRVHVSVCGRDSLPWRGAYLFTANARLDLRRGHEPRHRQSAQRASSSRIPRCEMESRERESVLLPEFLCGGAKTTPALLSH